MNKEDLKENYILLSKIAKEKKYAQEYLGLLARRGDIGSIRIGKRWYITREWFSEFLQDAQERKMKAEQGVTVEKITIEKKPDRVVFPAFSNTAVPFRKSKAAIDEGVGHASGFYGISVESRENEGVAAGRLSSGEERVIENNIALKISTPVAERPVVQVRQENFSIRTRPTPFSQPEIKRPIIDLRSAERAFKQVQEEEQSVKYRNIAIARKNNDHSTGMAQAPKDTDACSDYEVRRKSNILSPIFLRQEKPAIPWFPKLAIGFSFVLLFFLLFQGTFTYRKDIMKWAGLEKGTVAGTSDKRKSNLATLRSAADYFISNQDNQMKESVSLSQLMLRAALEKEKSSEEVK
jgi:hypothetical protein